MGVGVEDMGIEYEKWIWKQSAISRGDQEKFMWKVLVLTFKIVKGCDNKMLLRF